MKTSGLFTLHKFSYELGSTTEPLRLVVFGDVHRDSPQHAKSHWQDFLRYARSLKNAVFLGMGDYIDSASTSERSCLSRAELHESTRHDLEQLANAKVALLAKELDFMRGRLIGLINGNHFYQYESGMNSDQKLCEKLGCKYLGVSSFIKLSMCRSKEESRKTLDIWAHHGAGGARLVGGSLNRVDQMREFAVADIYLMGHDHKRGAIPATPLLSLENHKGELHLAERQQWLGRTGSFLKAYEPGMVSYNVDAARGPCSLGHIEFELSLRRRGGRKEIRHTELTIRGIA